MGWEASVGMKGLGDLQAYLQGYPTAENHWMVQKRSRLQMTLGNLVADVRYWGWRLTGGKW